MRCPACGAVDAADHRETEILGVPALLCPWLEAGRVLLASPTSAASRPEVERRALTPGLAAQDGDEAFWHGVAASRRRGWR